MALLEDVTLGSVLATGLIGVGLVIAAPLILPALGGLVVPVAREVFKGGVRLYDVGAHVATTMGEQLSDLVAEARAATSPTAENSLTLGPDERPASAC
jgi:Protein of unknown function (DUF5132)